MNGVECCPKFWFKFRFNSIIGPLRTSNATKRPQLKLSNDWCTQSCHTEIQVILAP